jgi:hypothetical protein
MPTFNSFDELEEVLDDINNNEKIEKIIKSSAIFVASTLSISALTIARKNHHKQL